jgi:hypothetical protein
MTVHNLHVVKPGERPVRQDTVAVLRDALKAAKRGEIVECVVIARYPDDMPDGTRWRELASGTTNFCEWVGRLEILKAGWIDQYRDITEHSGMDDSAGLVENLTDEDDEEKDFGEQDAPE